MIANLLYFVKLHSLKKPGGFSQVSASLQQKLLPLFLSPGLVYCLWFESSVALSPLFLSAAGCSWPCLSCAVHYTPARHHWPIRNWSGFFRHGQVGHDFSLIRDDNRSDCAAPCLDSWNSSHYSYPKTCSPHPGMQALYDLPLPNFRILSPSLSLLFLLLQHIGLLAGPWIYKPVPNLEALCFQPPLPGL